MYILYIINIYISMLRPATNKPPRIFCKKGQKSFPEIAAKKLIYEYLFINFLRPTLWYLFIFKQSHLSKISFCLNLKH